ncbi:DUF2116 family Zn-ribbon domain-containing protein [Epilithonimonas xixisoli]|uniref:Uncharacterized protein with Zn-ribbon domain DUF2116 n=1 Tax=Epilithonimonas xixisoli TaxID=1476462 RepID=A0A4R8I9V5_9FLAO|nr:DUF2116 family Zn-ribbon domain-containing protein [Epilithonimonas xixisoli]TDX86807.1 uncharacterized protein with Zn-ribbon domain DUF2116 [Epilithonimonas xixisoli]
METQTCPECGDKIIGRSDKKFCSDACRNAFNNKQNKNSTNYMRNVNNRLRKNYRILAEYNSEGKTKITKLKLQSADFDFDYVTQIVTYKNGSQYFFVYDQGYKILDNEWILIVKKTID